MAATVIINEWNGTSGAESATDKTSGTLRFKKADNATVDINNPLVKPVAGNDRSYEKWTRLRITGTGPTGEITNLRYWTDGSNNFGTGITAFVRTTNTATYATPAIPANDASGTNVFSFTSGSPKDADAISAGPFTGTNVNIGDFIILWMTIDNTVTGPGPTASETYSFSFDET